MAGGRGLVLLAALSCALTGQAKAATYDVSNLADSGRGSLRSAVVSANANPGGDAVVFGPGATGTIVLTDGPLHITDALTINGPGADALTVTPEYTSAIVNAPGAAVGVSGLRFAAGEGITAGSLFLADVEMSAAGPLTADVLQTLRSSYHSNVDPGELTSWISVGTTATFDASSLTDNVQGSGHEGGLINGDAAAVEIRDSTLTANAILETGAGGLGGGLASAAVERSVIAGNTTGDPSGTGDCVGGLVVLASDSVMGTDCALDPASGNVIRTDEPGMGPLQPGPTGTAFRPPEAASPAVDLAPVADCPLAPASPVDQRGFPRPFGPGCDAGAIELGSSLPPGAPQAATAPAAVTAGTQLPSARAGAARVGGLTVTALCPPAAPVPCHFTAKVDRSGARLATGRASVPPGQSRRFGLSLSAAGRRTLDRHRRVAGRLRVHTGGALVLARWLKVERARYLAP